MNPLYYLAVTYIAAVVILYFVISLIARWEHKSRNKGEK